MGGLDSYVSEATAEISGRNGEKLREKWNNCELFFRGPSFVDKTPEKSEKRLGKQLWREV
jgi:hypothetical protein